MKYLSILLLALSLQACEPALYCQSGNETSSVCEYSALLGTAGR